MVIFFGSTWTLPISGENGDKSSSCSRTSLDCGVSIFFTFKSKVPHGLCSGICRNKIALFDSLEALWPSLWSVRWSSYPSERLYSFSSGQDLLEDSYRSRGLSPLVGKHHPVPWSARLFGSQLRTQFSELSSLSQSSLVICARYQNFVDFPARNALVSIVWFEEHLLYSPESRELNSSSPTCAKQVEILQVLYCSCAIPNDPVLIAWTSHGCGFDSNFLIVLDDSS